LKLNYDEPLSHLAFNFNLRHYIKAMGVDNVLDFPFIDTPPKAGR